MDVGAYRLSIAATCTGAGSRIARAERGSTAALTSDGRGEALKRPNPLPEIE